MQFCRGSSMARFNPRVQRRAEGGGRLSGSSDDMNDDLSQESRRLFMQRGVSQLLFNYLPGRTVDWEDGLAIVVLETVRLASVWDEEKAKAVLDEMVHLFDRWRKRGGSIDPQFPDPRAERGRFSLGMPEV